MRSIFQLLFILFILPSVWGQDDSSSSPRDSLQIDVDTLKNKSGAAQWDKDQDMLNRLRTKAGQKVESKQSMETVKPAKRFEEKSRSRQSLNPEISVTGDLLGQYLFESPHFTDEDRSGFKFRVVEVAMQSNLDPFSQAKVIFEFSPEEIALAEGYVTWINPLPRINITAGKFRQQFGAVNRWHQHALEQIGYPLPLTLYMGEEGLNQVGVSFSWLPPAFIASANEVILEVTNSENDRLFSGESYGLPAVLFRLKIYHDLSRDTYLEWGISGIAGTNDTLGFTFDQSHQWTNMGGVDLTVSWNPVNKALYRGTIWRTELFYVRRQRGDAGEISALGGYSYVDWRLNRQFIVGLRGDFAQPLESDNKSRYLWQLSPYLTFWQSEYLFFRLDFSRVEGKNLDEMDNRVTLQLNWSLGPHKHEKY